MDGQTPAALCASTTLRNNDGAGSAVSTAANMGVSAIWAIQFLPSRQPLLAKIIVGYREGGVYAKFRVLETLLGWKHLPARALAELGPSASQRNGLDLVLDFGLLGHFGVGLYSLWPQGSDAAQKHIAPARVAGLVA